MESLHHTIPKWKGLLVFLAQVHTHRGGRRTRAECAPQTMASPLEWLHDTAAVSAHMAEHRVVERLEQGRGFARITSFLPAVVAEAAHTMLVEHDDWESMNDGEVAYRSDSVQHSFQFSEPEDHPNTLGLLANAVALLFDDLLPSFSAAKYCQGDGISPHDDKAHVVVAPKDGGPAVLHSRKYAGVLYLSKGWKLKFGGALLDMEACVEHVPSFNSFVVFTVPRMHAVAPILHASRSRLSLFGWWLQPGRLYELDDEVSSDLEAVEYVDVAELRAAGTSGSASGAAAHLKTQRRLDNQARSARARQGARERRHGRIQKPSTADRRKASQPSKRR